MKNKIIALYGRGNSGKTTTLTLVIEAFERFSKAKVIRLIDGVDIQAIITIDSLKIGIETQGDPNSRLETSLNFFEQEGCVIIICATRTRGKTVDIVNNHKPNYDIKWIKKLYGNTASEQEKINKKDAEVIFDLAMREYEKNEEKT
jgi:hypothetical protein